MFTSRRRILTIVIVSFGLLSAALSIHQASVRSHAACSAQHAMFSGFKRAVGMSTGSDPSKGC